MEHSRQLVIFDNSQRLSEMLSEALQSAKRNGAALVERNGSKKSLSEMVPLLRLKQEQQTLNLCWSWDDSWEKMMKMTFEICCGEILQRCVEVNGICVVQPWMQRLKNSVFWISTILEPLCKLWRGKEAVINHLLSPNRRLHVFCLSVGCPSSFG
ncbi:hypothetical protein QQF64_035152 [Cirrhinus molitorella]|uniref:Uncharacterized protein n=1 Tax=Cirrhinus molitorella TaxID=172907 RepID=A0ABR3NF66_9TELE